tara:strand:+ start:75 stop:716 length:642 start_codon:yes stop_codon:yes gene_type:complete
MPNSLEIQLPLSSDKQVIKINDDSTGLLIKDNRVFVEEQPTEENEVATKKYVDTTNLAGNIIGYTDIGLNETRVDLSLTTSYVVPTDEHSVAFTAPASGNVEIYMQVAFSAGSGGAGDLYVGLSTANATSGYSALQDYYEEELVDQSGRFGWETVVNSWTLTGLTAGANYEYWVGFKSTSTSGTPTVSWGGDTSGHYSDFIMKATSLPTTITT